MNKFINLFSSILLTLTPVLFLSSCSDDDDNPSSANKRIKTILYSNEDDETVEQTFTYDNSGRIISEIWIQPNGDRQKTTYEYNDSEIICHPDAETTETYTLIDGLVANYTYSHSFVTQTVKYSYDNNRRLIKIDNGNQSENDNVKWDNNNITSILDATYTYSNIDATRGYCNYGIDWVLYSQGYFGKCSQNLFKTVTVDGATVNYNYELKDGYVVKAKNSYGEVMTYIWE